MPLPVPVPCDLCLMSLYNVMKVKKTCVDNTQQDEKHTLLSNLTTVTLTTFLRRNGTDPEFAGHLLCHAVSQHQIRVVRMTLNQLANPNSWIHASYIRVADRFQSGLVLGRAVCNGDVDIVRLLLEFGADPNAVAADHQGLRKTAMWHAVDRSDERIGALLLVYGADPQTLIDALPGFSTECRDTWIKALDQVSDADRIVRLAEPLMQLNAMSFRQVEKSRDVSDTSTSQQSGASFTCPYRRIELARRRTPRRGHRSKGVCKIPMHPLVSKSMK